MIIKSLHDRARTGDREAQEELFKQLQARFRLFARQRLRRNTDVEEVVQEALKTVFEKYQAVDFEISFTAWAYKVLHHRLLTYVATESRRSRILEEKQPMVSQMTSASPDIDLERRLLECLRRVNSVSGRHARILNLHYHGYTVAEICERARLTQTNFYTILSRARAMLAACLERGRYK